MTTIPQRLLALSCACLLGAYLPAQEGKGKQQPEKEIPIPSDRDGKETIELTLREALMLGRRNNTNLRADELLPRQTAQDLRGARSIFEPELVSNLGISKTKDASRNTFQPALVRMLYDASFGVRQLTPVGGQVDLTYAPARLDQTTVVPGFPSTQFTSRLTATYRQPLLRGAWSDYTLRNVRIQESALAASRLRFGRTVQDTLLAVVQGYWELVFARENYRVVVKALELAREQLRITNERIRVKDLAERDRVADEAEVARRTEDLITAENEIRNREDILRRLLFDDQDGKLWSTGIRPISPMDVLPDAKREDWRPQARLARDHRPDLMALRADVAIAEVQLMAARRDVLPQLDLVGSYQTDGVRDTFGEALSDTVGFGFTDWSVMLQMSVPIGNNAALAVRDRALLQLERARRILYSAEMDVAQEVREALRRIRTLALSIAASRESLRLATTDLDTERQKLRVGLSTQFEVQRRNQALLDARTQHLRNQLDYQIAQANVLHVEGLLGVPEGGRDGRK